MPSTALRPPAPAAEAGPRAARVHVGSDPPEAAGLVQLRLLPFLAGAPDEALARLAARARWQTCPAGAVILDTDETSDEVYFVLDGTVRVVVRTAQGYEAILADLGRGDFFGELTAIDGTHRSANVTALLTTRLCVVPGPAFVDLALGVPAVGLRLLRLLAARVRAKDERMLESAALPARQRIMAELLRLSRERGGGQRSVSPPPPHHILGARVGLRRETVSREMTRLARDGLLTVARSAIVLHRPEALRAEIDTWLRGGTGI